MHIDEFIDRAIVVFENASPGAEYQDLIKTLEGENIPSNISSYLVFFLPIAFTRIICKNLNISFTDVYIAYFEKGDIDQGLLSTNSIFRQIMEYSVKFITSSPKKDLILKIAGTSPEFEIINTCLLKNLDASEISFSPLKLQF